jgi:hypothetical protein
VLIHDYTETSACFATAYDFWSKLNEEVFRVKVKKAQCLHEIGFSSTVVTKTKYWNIGYYPFHFESDILSLLHVFF